MLNATAAEDGGLVKRARSLFASCVDCLLHPARPSFWIYLIPLVAVIVLAAFTPIDEHDIFWHLKTGEIIWKNFSIPREDIFSYTALGQPWFNLEWLSEVVFWPLYRALGWNGMIAFKVACTVAIAVSAWRIFRLFSLSPTTAAWGVFLIMLCIQPRIQARPHLVTDVLTIVYALVLFEYIMGRRRTIWMLVPLQIVWTNAHGGSVMGIEMLAAVAAGEWLQKFFPDGPQPTSERRRKHLLAVLALSAVASVVNPWKWNYFTFVVEHVFAMKTILNLTYEWSPPWEKTFDLAIPFILYRILLVVALASCIFNRKKMRMSHLFLMLLAVMMSIKASRFTSQFFILGLPLAFANFRTAFPPREPARPLVPAWTHAAAILSIAVFLTWFGIPVTTDLASRTAFGGGIRPMVFPYGAVDFLDRNDVHGRIFNEMSEGGYLIWNRWPGEMVHMDGRTPVYGEEFFSRYIDAFRNAHNFDAYLKAFAIDYVLLDAMQGWPFRHLHRYLRDSPDWKLVYADARSYLYLKDVPKFAKIIKIHAIEKHPLFEK